MYIDLKFSHQIVQLPHETAEGIAETEKQAAFPTHRPIKMFVKIVPINFNNLLIQHNFFAVSWQRRLGSVCWDLCHAINWAKLCHELETDNLLGLPNPSSMTKWTTKSHLVTFGSIGLVIWMPMAIHN
jgi:hypothetical protein